MQNKKIMRNEIQPSKEEMKKVEGPCLLDQTMTLQSYQSPNYGPKSQPGNMFW